MHAAMRLKVEEERELVRSCSCGWGKEQQHGISNEAKREKEEEARVLWQMRKKNVSRVVAKSRKTRHNASLKLTY